MSAAARLRARLAGSTMLRSLLGRPDPLTVTAWERLDHHDHALRDITAALEVLHGQAARLEQHLPELLNTVASTHGSQRLLKRNIDESQLLLQAQVDDVQSQIHAPEEGLRSRVFALYERIEMVRREILFEMRYPPRDQAAAGGAASAGAVGGGEVHEVTARIVDQEAVDASVANGLRINLGCGHVPLEGYVNVDMRELPGVQMVAAVDDLPVEEASVAEIFSAHVLEHFPQEQLSRQLLPYWLGLLRPGGELRAIVPDAGAMLEHYALGEMPYEQLREVTFGGQEYEGDFHFNMFTTASLSGLLVQAGFADVTIEDEGRRNGLCYELQVVARRPD